MISTSKLLLGFAVLSFFDGKDVLSFTAAFSLPRKCVKSRIPNCSIKSKELTRTALSSGIEGTVEVDEDLAAAETSTKNRQNIIKNVVIEEEKKYWEIGQTQINRQNRPIPPKLVDAIERNVHPEETQEELGYGTFITPDWRRAWYTYQSPSEIPDLIDPVTGYAEYEIEDIDGEVPDDLVGVMYRNGPGKFGVDGDRVQHVLDADGLIIKVTFPPLNEHNGEKRKFTFRSYFVQTKALLEEEKAKQYLYRGTFGTAPRGLQNVFGKPKRLGLNKDPEEVPILSKIAGNAMKTDIKNPANTQIISFGGKVLALFEAGLPYRIDPVTLETLGEDDMGGTLAIGKMPVKLGNNIPEAVVPSFLGGAAHTAHPKICPDNGNLVGWQWSVKAMENSLEITFNEWDANKFSLVASSTFALQGCALAPHDMALTENCILLQANSLEMNDVAFLSGMKGPAASLKLNGRANAFVHVFPRPTAKNQFDPYVVEVPPTFSIHFSHGYEDPDTGNIVCMYSGWPPSDAKDFLGAWGGFAPDYAIIPPTFLWKLQINPQTKTCVDLSVAPGATNVCAEFVLVHPNFRTKKANYVYAVASNVVGDSSAPCGYVKLDVEDGSTDLLAEGEKNTNVDVYWFGTRFFVGEPLIVPKKDGDAQNEKAAYLLGMVYDSVRGRSAVAIFDLEKDLKSGPIAMLWLKSWVPHGLHGCFAAGGNGESSVFC